MLENSKNQYKLTDHYELLVRLSDTDQLVISPGQFLPVAERYGLTATIDRWMVRQYLQFPPDQHLHSINLSAASICDRGFVEFVSRELSKSSVAPNLLGFEISEKFIKRYPKQSQHLLQGLQYLGCQIAIDDVSFVLTPQQLCADLPANFLKFSGQLVQMTIQHPAVRNRTQKQVEQVHSFGGHTIAKGIDQACALEPLRQIGIDYAQGYQLYYPMPLDSTTTASISHSDPNLA